MNISGLKTSRFLTKEDCSLPILVTIESVNEINVAKEGAPEEYRWCVHFKETEKPMVLNSTNGQIIAKMTGQDDTDDWTGVKVVLYNDPNVSFGGKIVGGIRCRAPRVKPAAPAPAAAPRPAPRPVAPVAPPAPFEEGPDDSGESDEVPY
jgi:hypothetical protein